MIGFRIHSSRLSRWLTAGFFFVLAVAVRSVNYRGVVTSDGVRPFGYDSYYHLRRIHWDLIHFPRHLSFDPYLSPPTGEAAIWTPTFDWLLAAIVHFSLGDGDWSAAERLLIWIPPVLGGATVVVLHALAYPRFGSRVAGLAALVLSLLPAHVHFSQIGYIDHHCAVSLASVSLMLVVLSFLHRSAAAQSLDRSTIGVSVLLGLLLGGALLLWPGSLLHVGIAEVALLASVLGSKEPDRVVLRSQLLALAHLVAFALVMTFWLASEESRFEGMNLVALSSFQPALFAVATLYFAALPIPILWGRRGPLSPLQRALVAGVVGIGFATILLLVPEVVGLLHWVSLVFSGSNPFMAVVTESVPLHTFPIFSLTSGSGFLLLAPVFIVALAFWARREPRAAEYWAVAWWSLALLAAVLAQRRFFNSFAVPFSLLIAWGWLGLHDLVGRRFRNSPVRVRAGLHVAVATGALALLSPTALHFEHWRTQLYGSPPFALAVREKAFFEAADWLRENTPATAGYLDITEQPEYTLLSAWGDGHRLRYVAERAPVADNFGINFRVPESYFAAQSEDEALDVVAPLGVRYVVVRRSGSGHNSDYAPLSHFHSLFRRGGSGTISSTGVQYSVQALSRHRMVFASPLSGRQRQPLYRIFEIVKGARMVGEAVPGSTIGLSLLLNGVGDLPFLYESSVAADTSGRFEFRVPYPTDHPSGQFRPRPTYQLRNGPALASLAVSEEAVRLGLTITAPSFAVEASVGSRN